MPQLARQPYLKKNILLPYSFVCEKCGYPSGMRQHVFLGAEQGTWGFPINETEEIVRADAQWRMPFEFSRLVRQIDRGRCPFDAECPHCHARQSWGDFRYLLSLADKALPIVFILLFIAALLWRKGALSFGVLLAGFLLLSAGVLAGYLLPEWIRVRKNRKSITPRKPLIYWDKIQYSTTMEIK